ncbi:DUF1499 domain-containing protein [Methylomarinum vadi]|uniref:DUF1499 domain-containing protein n=1 Tax=Methylomarinum vadi TaxID=438855 RepID=UPI00055C473D|nr:DUF1499 domain-containing protein [Methylomarinum vadi]
MNNVPRFGLIMAGLLLFSFMAIIRLSHSAPKLGLSNGKLLPCPKSPNCVCSENEPALALRLEGYPPEQAWQLLQNIVAAQGGEITAKNETYLHAKFYSKWMRFIDDFEARLDREAGLIQLRSAARTGYYDFNVNRKRVETIRKKMNVYLRSQSG